MARQFSDEAAAKQYAERCPAYTRIVDMLRPPTSTEPSDDELWLRGSKVNPHSIGVPPANPPNPKQRYGDTKVNLALVPPAGVIFAALGFHDGGIKYGPFNWRQDAIEIMTYIAACRRHLDAFVDGEELSEIELWSEGLRDSEPSHILGGKPHLGYALACLMILADAISLNHVIDNRPLPGPAPSLLSKWKRDLAR